MTTLRCVIIASRNEQGGKDSDSHVSDDELFPEVPSRRSHSHEDDDEDYRSDRHKLRDYICSICEKEVIDKKDSLRCCRGGCCRVFHSKCLGLGEDEEYDSWICDDCKNKRSICFNCGKEGLLGSKPVELKRCEKEDCGKAYCIDCIKNMKNIQSKENPFYCCLHICLACNKEASKPRPIVRCIKCPTAYHRIHLPEGWKEIMKMRYICPKHLTVKEKAENEAKVKEENEESSNNNATVNNKSNSNSKENNELKPEPKKRGRKPKSYYQQLQLQQQQQLLEQQQKQQDSEDIQPYKISKITNDDDSEIDNNNNSRNVKKLIFPPQSGVSSSVEVKKEKIEKVNEEEKEREKEKVKEKQKEMEREKEKEKEKKIESITFIQPQLKEEYQEELLKQQQKEKEEKEKAKPKQKEEEEENKNDKTNTMLEEKEKEDNSNKEIETKNEKQSNEELESATVHSTPVQSTPPPPPTTTTTTTSQTIVTTTNSGNSSSGTGRRGGYKRKRKDYNSDSEADEDTSDSEISEDEANGTRKYKRKYRRSSTKRFHPTRNSYKEKDKDKDIDKHQQQQQQQQQQLTDVPIVNSNTVVETENVTLPVNDVLLQQQQMQQPIVTAEETATTTAAATTAVVAEVVNWIECEKCHKWRIVPTGYSVDEKCKWECNMMTWLDPSLANCDKPEDQAPIPAIVLPVTNADSMVIQNGDMTASSSLSASPTGLVNVNLPVTSALSLSAAATMNNNVNGLTLPNDISYSTIASAPNSGNNNISATPDKDSDSDSYTPRKKLQQKKKTANETKPKLGADDYQWIRCCRKECRKWRRIPKSVDLDSLGTTWTCENNTWFPKFANCYVEQEDPTQINKNKKKINKQRLPSKCAWIECDLCKKWRLLPPGVKTESLPEKWYCSLNKGDKLIMTCSAAEETEEDIQKKLNNHIISSTTGGKSKSNNKTYIKILDSYITLREKCIDAFNKAEKKSLTPLNKSFHFTPYSLITNGKKITASKVQTTWVVPGSKILTKEYDNYTDAYTDYMKDVSNKQKEQCLYSEILHILESKNLSFETIKDMLSFNGLCSEGGSIKVEDLFDKLIKDKLIEEYDEGPLDKKYRRTNNVGHLYNYVHGPLKFSKPWKRVNKH